jgi:hypothetical protein
LTFLCVEVVAFEGPIVVSATSDLHDFVDASLVAKNHGALGLVLHVLDLIVKNLKKNFEHIPYFCEAFPELCDKVKGE